MFSFMLYFKASIDYKVQTQFMTNVFSDTTGLSEFSLKSLPALKPTLKGAPLSIQPVSVKSEVTHFPPKCPFIQNFLLHRLLRHKRETVGRILRLPVICVPRYSAARNIWRDIKIWNTQLRWAWENQLWTRAHWKVCCQRWAMFWSVKCVIKTSPLKRNWRGMERNI